MTEPAGGSAVDRWLDLGATLLLALAAVATAWASYQSAGWRGEQAKAGGASISARVESTRAAALANDQRSIDVALFTQWIDAYAQDETELATFYRKRFRPEFEPAFDAWVATRPRENPGAPLSPFALPEYKLAAQAEADALEARASAKSLEVATDIQRADNYVLTVVLFAVALLFAGLGNRLPSRTSRVVILSVAWVLFLGTVAWLATFPVSLST
ncbi:MAG TPA: hypothetical protein VD836_05110 [Solirubrobacteraceae bacterium]|nr:hypothetical protein [Solirubrobacteraceae bacterium]